MYFSLEAKSLVSLTVEGGVSLVGPHCPGTVRLFCEGVDLVAFGWTYNTGNPIASRIDLDYEVTSSVFYPRLNNPPFISINITNVSPDYQRLTANFSSVLTVDLLELNNKNIRNITCGDFREYDTLEVDVTRKTSEHFTPNITATFHLGVLSITKVQWTKLVSHIACL